MADTHHDIALVVKEKLFPLMAELPGKETG